MAKVYGINGYATGKLGNQVLAIRNGEQIARQYQPIVTNPNTQAQVAVRAKLKLMSQLSAAVAQYIAIPREGAKSSRNIFTSINFDKATYDADLAKINLEQIQLTKSSIGFETPQLSLDENNLVATWNNDISTQFDKVVVVLMRRNEAGYLQPLSSTTVDTAAVTTAQVPCNYTGKVYLYAYGVSYTNEKARAYFQNITIPTASDFAQIVTSRVLTSGDMGISQTVCCSETIS